ncbi:hypothetical protein V8C37DRAFT_398130 [Trichoderma ceciliae]
MATEAPLPMLIEPRTIHPPPYDLLFKDEIKFFHPGYEEPSIQFLSLARVDCDNSNSTPVFGVYYKTALIACQIIANNRFNAGRLALDRAGLQRVSISLDGILTENKYFFIIDEDEKYPIVPSFRDWKFPHDDVPTLWPPNLTISPVTSPSCCITNVSYAVDGAHIVPREEAAWYTSNAMAGYGGGIDNEANILRMRKDLHNCFDNRWFAIVPKTTLNGAQYVTHILPKKAAEIWPTYHNVGIQLLPTESRPYLFARFAWAILLQVKAWITIGIPRNVIRVQVDKEKGTFEYKMESIAGPQLQFLYGGGGSKAATPMKRKYQDIQEEFEDNFSGELSSGSDLDIGADDYWNMETEESGQRRSVNRRQESSDDTIPDATLRLPEDIQKELERAAADLIAAQDAQELSELSE